LSQELIRKIERDLGVPTKRAQAAAELADLALKDPVVAWPALAKWGAGNNAPIREAIAEAVAHVVEAHFDEIAPALAQTAANDDRFGNVVLPPCFRVMKAERFKTFQAHLRAAISQRRKTSPDELPMLEDIIDDDDTDFFAMDLLDHLLAREELSEPERIAQLLLMLNIGVGVGGLEQFYVNSSGDESTRLAAALEAVGASNLAEIVEQINQLFGSRGPSQSQVERRAQIAGFSTGAQQEWLRLIQEFDQAHNDVVSLLQRYVRKHRGSFGAA